jgi:hypothetical protein
MARQNQQAAEKQERASRSTARGPDTEMEGESTDLRSTRPSPISAVPPNTIPVQAARLSDPETQTVQRQVLAVQIGRVQGNQHLQQVVSTLKPERKRVKVTQRGAQGISRTWENLGYWSWESSIRGTLRYDLRVGSWRDWEWVLQRGDESYIMPMLLALTHPNWVGARHSPSPGLMTNWQNTIADSQSELTRSQIMGFMLALYRSSRGLQIPSGVPLLPFSDEARQLLPEVIRRYQPMVLMEESELGPGIREEGARRLAAQAGTAGRQEMIQSAGATAMAAPVRIVYANSLRDRGETSRADAEERNANDEIRSAGVTIRETYRAGREIQAAQAAVLETIFETAWGLIPGAQTPVGAALAAGLKQAFKTMILNAARQTEAAAQLTELNRLYAEAVENLQEQGLITPTQYANCRDAFQASQARSPDES